MRLEIEQIHLWRVGLWEGVFKLGGFRLGVFFLGLGFGGVHFQVRKNGFCAGEDGLGKAGESRNLNAVGFVRGAGENFVEEDDFLIPFTHRDVAIHDGFAGVGEVGEFVVMGGEERAAFDLVVQMLGDRPGDGEAVEGGCSASDFIENDQGFFGGVVEDEGGFRHLDHEGGLTA